MEEHIVDLGSEPEISSFDIEKEKVNINPYDIFRLARGILIVAGTIYILLAMIRIFYQGNPGNNEGIKEVWEYSKVFLNSIVSLVLGLYFGSKQEPRTIWPKT